MFFIFQLFFLCSNAIYNYEEYKFFETEKKNIVEIKLTEATYTNMFLQINKDVRSNILDILMVKNKHESSIDKKIYAKIAIDLTKFDKTKEKILNEIDKQNIKRILLEKASNNNSRNYREKRYFEEIFVKIYDTILTNMFSIQCEYTKNTYRQILQTKNRLYHFFSDYSKLVNAERLKIYVNIQRFVDDEENNPITIKKILTCFKLLDEAHKSNKTIIMNCLIKLVTTKDIHDKSAYEDNTLAKMKQDLLEDIKSESTIYDETKITIKTYDDGLKSEDNTNNKHNETINAIPYQHQSMFNLKSNPLIDWVCHTKLWCNGIKEAVKKERCEDLLDTYSELLTNVNEIDLLYKKYIIFISNIFDEFYVCSLQQLEAHYIVEFTGTLNILRVNVIMRIIQKLEIYKSKVENAKKEYNEENSAKKNIMIKLCAIFESNLSFFAVESKNIALWLCSLNPNEFINNLRSNMCTDSMIAKETASTYDTNSYIIHTDEDET